jgi:tRNA uridine 5-carboxymethylaminomethyl modification enzyme
LLAGINAAVGLRDPDEAVVLRRDQAYAGVLVDDLVTKGTREPYRMFTSRAEYRLILREDNTADRVLGIGRRLGLVSDERWARFERFTAALAAARERAERATVLGTAAVNAALEAVGSAPVRDRRISLAELLKRPELDYAAVMRVASAGDVADAAVSPAVAERVEIELKYDGYLKRQETEAARLARFEDVRLPAELDYSGIQGLSREAVEQLSSVQPRSLGQASRVAGVTPVAVSILVTHLNLTRRRSKTLGEP